MTWSFEHSADSGGTAHRVWCRYVDVEHWSEWSPGVQWSRLDGPFEIGATGKTKPPGFPAFVFRVAAVEPHSLFATEGRLPGARMRVEHRITSLTTGVRITHRATVSGPLGALWARVVRRSFERNLPASVDRLAALCEQPDSG